MKVQKKEIESQLMAIAQTLLLEKKAGRAARAISLDASLERELGIGSLGKVELFHRIENTFSIRLPDATMIDAETLRDLVPLIEKAAPHISASFKREGHAPVLKESLLDLSKITTFTNALHLYKNKEPERPHIYLQDNEGSEQTISYGELFDNAMSVARGLHQRGIRPGEAVAIMLPTSDAFFYAFAGILLAGAIPIPIYPPFRPDKIEEYAKREAKILHNAQARMLITFSRAEILSNILRTFIPSLKEVIKIKNLQSNKGDLPEIQVTPQDILLLQYTSGSTGNPKGVTLTHENMLANIRGIGQAIPLQPTDTGVSWLPLYHDMGLMNWLAGLYYGLPITFMSPLTFLSRPEKWFWAIHYHQATLSGGPNFAYELCVKKINAADIEGLDLSSWRFAFNGAEAIQPKTLEKFTQKFAPYGFKPEAFAPVYGLAEATVALTFPPQKRKPRIDKIEREAFEKKNQAIPAKTNLSEKEILEFVACGSPLPEHEIRIVDDAENSLEERYVGNIQFKGPSGMQGYFNNPAATQRAFHDGWWDTGDLGYIADNEIFITGRKKDLIIKAGRNLSPEEVESIVNEMPSIRKGCVIAFGVDDPKSGTEKLVVVAETYESNKKAQQEIRTKVIEKMSIMLGIPPDAVLLVPPHVIPKTSSGKLQRSACKQDYIAGKLAHSPLPVKLQFIKLLANGLLRKIVYWLTYTAKFVYLIYVSIILFIMLLPLWLSLLILPPSRAAKVCKAVARTLFRMIGCPIRIKGKQYLENHSPVIYVANHASYVDSILLLGILPPGVILIGKKELLNVPILRTFIKKLKFLTIDRTDFAKSLEDTKKIATALKQKRSILIFPEGTFTYATGLRPFKLGAFSLSAETQTPLCPIAIRGTRTILRGDTFLPKPGKITLTIGEWIHPRERQDWDEIMRLHGKVRAEIAKHCGEPVIDLITAGPVLE